MYNLLKIKEQDARNEDDNSSNTSAQTDYDELLNDNTLRDLNDELRKNKKSGSKSKEGNLVSQIFNDQKSKDYLKMEKRIKYRMRKAQKSSLYEICRIPEIYTQKSKRERLTESCETLARIQNLPL